MATDSPPGPSNDRPYEGDRLAAVVASLAGFSSAEKLELIERIARSIRSEGWTQLDAAYEAERTEQQHLRLMELLASLDSLPSKTPEDGFSNRDHDKILYGPSS